MTRFNIPAALLAETFRHFRECGGGRRECQVLWTSAWDSPGTITRVTHSQHHGHVGGFQVDDGWLNAFWIELAEIRHGVRIQVHTHPYEAFHSETDDAYPIVHMPGFLSLVIPNFGVGEPSLKDCFLCEISESGPWRPVTPESRILVIP